MISEQVNGKRVAISQSNYIPWKGYFDLIRQADVFVLYDDMQFTRRDWRNRNRIQTISGLQWLTIPVKVKGRYYQAINQTQVVDSEWAERHWQRLEHNYQKSPFFPHYRSWLQSLYEQASHLDGLSDINLLFIGSICEQLDIRTQLLSSRDLTLVEGKSERLLGICQQLGANCYISGPAAQSYMDLELFQKAGIEVQWMDYRYPVYPQRHAPFEHGVTVLDLLFNVGPDASTYLKRI